MSIQNGQPLIAATRNETSGTSPFGNFPDFAIEAPSALAARRIGGQCAMTFVVFNTSPQQLALLGELLLQDRIAAVILDFPHPRHRLTSF